ncbi:MAG: hypothetical protein ABMB14_06835, partial [Myxococcota bacterium]
MTIVLNTRATPRDWVPDLGDRLGPFELLARVAPGMFDGWDPEGWRSAEVRAVPVSHVVRADLAHVAA